MNVNLVNKFNWETTPKSSTSPTPKESTIQKQKSVSRDPNQSSVQNYSLLQDEIEKVTLTETKNRPSEPMDLKKQFSSTQ